VIAARPGEDPAPTSRRFRSHDADPKTRRAGELSRILQRL
jgi:hypothetical protein